MFIHTRAIGKKVIGELRFLGDVLSFLLQLLYIGFLVFSISTNRGNRILNTVLLCITASFFIFMLYFVISRDSLSKNTARKIKHAYRITLLLFKGFSLGVTVYGIYVALGDFNSVSVILAALMFVAWVLGVLVEFVRIILERYTDLMTSAIIKDTAPMVSLYNKLTFKHTENRKETKTDVYVEDITNEYKEELRTKKESKKAREEAERLIRRENRRETLENIAQNAKNKIKALFSLDNEENNEDEEEEED